MTSDFREAPISSSGSSPEAAPALPAEAAASTPVPKVSWQTRLKEELTEAKKTYQKHVNDILEKYADNLGQLPDVELDKLVQDFVGLVTSSEIYKAAEYGRNNIPKFVFANKALTMKTIAGLPKKDIQILGDENATVKVKGKGNRIKEVPVKRLVKDPLLTRKVIDVHHPEKGILPPSEQDKRQTYVPDYHTLIAIIPDKDNNLACLLVFKQNTPNDFKRPDQERKLRVLKAELPNMIKMMEDMISGK